MRPRLGLALLAGLLLCGCSGNAPAIPTASHGGGGTAAPTQEPASGPANYTPHYFDRDMSIAVDVLTPCGEGPSGSYDLHQAITRSRGAAIVQGGPPGAPRWNTPDGTRPSQAYIDQLANHPVKVNGYWQPDAEIDTPVTVTVTRVLHGPVPTPTLTAFIHGGALPGPHGNDKFNTCAPAFTPGQTYLALFGAELTTGEDGDAPIAQPLLVEALPYDARLNEAYTPTGPETP